MKLVRITGVFFLTIALGFCMFGCASETYEPQLAEASISSPNIIEDGVLTVGVDTSNSPLAGMGNDKIIGIDVDIAAALADELGLSLSIVDVGSSPDTALSAGTVDIVMGIDSSDSYDDMWLSSEYLPTGVAVFAMSSSTAAAPQAGDDVKIAAQVSSKSAWSVTNIFGSSALSSTQDLSSAFEILSSGQVNFLASDAVIGMYAANRNGDDVKIVELLGSKTGYCAGALTSNSALQSAVGEALDKLIDNGTIDVIQMKWLGQTITLTSSSTSDSASSSSSSTSAADISSASASSAAENTGDAETGGTDSSSSSASTA